MRFKKRWLFGSLIVGWLVLAWSGWLPRPTEAQKKSVALLEGPPMSATGKRNAFPALWFSPYDVPPSELDGRMRSDLERYRSYVGVTNNFQPGPQGTLPNQLLHKNEQKSLCTAIQVECLAKIRLDRDEVKVVLDGHSALLDRLRALREYDYVHNLFPPDFFSPIPVFTNQGALLDSDAALQFVNGNQAEGLSRVCAAAATWRRFALHSDHLLVQMVASRNFQGAAILFGEMLAESSLNAPLPSECEEAFSPMTATATDLCDSMRWEYLANKSTIALLEDNKAPMWNTVKESRRPIHFGRALVITTLKFVLHPDGTVAMYAPTFASMCTHDADVHAEAVRLGQASMFGYCGVQGMMFNPVGCDIARRSNQPTFLGYPAKFGVMFDANRLVRASMNMRESVGVTQPKNVGATGGGKALPDVVEDSARKTLSVRRLFIRAGESPDISIPMPASRLH